MSQTDPRLLLLSPDDNVLVARAPIAAGEPIRVEGLDLPSATAFSLGHKLARRPIRAGDPVAGRIIEGTASVDEIGQEIFDLVLEAASGGRPARRRWATPNSS